VRVVVVVYGEEGRPLVDRIGIYVVFDRGVP